MASITARVRAYCARRREIVAAYLFGSTARGEAGPLSDIDIALLLEKRRAGLRESLTYQASRLTELMAALGTDEVDLVLLPNSSPLLQHRVLRHGKLLYCRSQRRRVAFECEALRTYLDLLPIYERQTDRFIEQIGAGQPRRARRHG